MVKTYIVEKRLARIEGGELDKPPEKKEKAPKKRKGDRGDEKEGKRSKKDKGDRSNESGGPIKSLSLSLKIKLGGPK